MDQREQRGELFRKKRELKGLSREKVTSELKCTPESVRRWETGERNPNVVHTLSLCRILDIKLEELEAEPEKRRTKETVDGDSVSIYSADQLIRDSKLLTIYYKKNQIYLQKNLREQLKSSVEISIHPQNEKELLVRETNIGAVQSIYYCAEIVRKISRAVQVNDNMRFLCIWDEAEKGWRGILLPEMSESFLWENLRRYGEYSGEDTTWKQLILHVLYRKCWNLVEREEIDLFYCLAYRMAVCSNPSGGKKIWYLVLMYAYMLVGEIKRVQRRCKKAEAPLSLNQSVRENDSCMLQEFWTGGEIPHMAFEIEEFMERLTKFERIILKWKIQERELEKNISFGYGLKVLIQDAVCRFQEKANDYYGRDYIRSLLVMGR